ncbi:FecR family protein [Mucilaginibacter aquaedulcis]|uniref:FecR family protein n=1 Tax=Mucilaginibacter aquaedulcis TaxID=1187081 RepID=UPI0025B515D6|nr:FecR family protein [Mucilaginibacter aquaedulcis]MDN3551507.1 FecR domain-containing protein [Mucilaginibacter aquaedulcis]
MKPSEFKYLINRYLNREADNYERELIDVWYQSFDEQGEELSYQKEQQLKAEMHDKIKHVWHGSAKHVKLFPVFKYAAIAATICIAAFIGFHKYFTKPGKQAQENYLSINTGTREVKKVELPDGSAVWLNANSHIRISDHFQKQQQRYVYLDEGEAFFSVKKNPKRPFIVFTKSISTRVLGTSFNINSYNTLHKAIVTVATGRVQVSTKAKVLAVVTPGLQINYAIVTGKYQVDKSDAGQAQSWKNGQTILNQANFDELALIIKNVYGAQLISQNKAAAHYKYNLHINTTHTLDETMKIICSVHQNTFKRRNNNEVIIY